MRPRFSVPQPFDHLADRNLALIRPHADSLPGDAATPFRHGPANAG
jgi:deaminated glutathione amidase